MVWILLRLLVGAKCTKVWRWWQSEVQDMRFPSIVHGKPWSFLSISCKISPCLGLYLAFSRYRIFFHLKWKISSWSHVVQFQVRFPHIQLNRFSLFIWCRLEKSEQNPIKLGRLELCFQFSWALRSQCNLNHTCLFDTIKCDHVTVIC